ncbi:MAG: Organic hydroperoxide resistance protein [uncultured Paraburkholderia sp.]|nr:MAG: Organic hydroperoxide resistance protein [uncultured Paraburkholderia sp.]CAH2937420.1 MAG: Organic hydroperoxide resistance protein [uncultured Paraburkholderia sp.]
MNILYKASATSTGGRDGRAVSSDNALDVKLAAPRELGGNGTAGTNPEQLFAAGYSTCFLSAMKFVAGQRKQTLPGLAPEAAKELVDAAHQVCPYSNATRNNVDVRLHVA